VCHSLIIIIIIIIKCSTACGMACLGFGNVAVLLAIDFF
jgi:hypothetical protein